MLDNERQKENQKHSAEEIFFRAKQKVQQLHATAQVRPKAL